MAGIEGGRYRGWQVQRVAGIYCTSTAGRIEQTLWFHHTGFLPVIDNTHTGGVIIPLPPPPGERETTTRNVVIHIVKK